MIQHPLTEKAIGCGARKLRWSEEMDAAFHELKAKIQEDVRLSYPDYSTDASPLELYVDASASGAAVSLSEAAIGN